MLECSTTANLNNGFIAETVGMKDLLKTAKLPTTAKPATTVNNMPLPKYSLSWRTDKEAHVVRVKRRNALLLSWLKLHKLITK